MASKPKDGGASALPPRPDLSSIRQIWSDHGEQHRDHLLRLDEENRRNRFGGTVSDEFLRDYTDAERHPDRLVYGFFAGGILRGVVELQMSGPGFPHEAEVALSVERPWQGLGVGTRLLDRALLAARNRGIAQVRMTSLADNEPMKRLARKRGATLHFQVGAGLVGEFPTQHATPASMTREIVADAFGLFGTLVDTSRLWPARG